MWGISKPACGQFMIRRNFPVVAKYNRHSPNFHKQILRKETIIATTQRKSNKIKFKY